MQTLQRFVWFLWQSVNGAIIWVGLAVFVVAMAIALWRSQRVETCKYCLLLVLPLLWIFAGLWGGNFWVDWQAKPFVPNPNWVGVVLTVTAGLYLAASLALIVYCRGIRLFVTLFAVLNLYFMLAMIFLASMAISGTWL